MNINQCLLLFSTVLCVYYSINYLKKKHFRLKHHLLQWTYIICFYTNFGPTSSASNGPTSSASSGPTSSASNGPIICFKWTYIICFKWTTSSASDGPTSSASNGPTSSTSQIYKIFNIDVVHIMG